MKESLGVNLGERSYNIDFGGDLTGTVKAKIGELRQAGRKMAVLTDQNVAAQQGGALHSMFGDLPTLAVAAGEGSKSLDGLGTILTFLAEQRLDRSAVLFVVGGGVIGDLGGFA